MATTSPWKDTDEKFCLCSICLEQLREPKLLPCLHRYCKDCLNSIIQGANDVIKCPECRQETQIPTNGVDGFKTDFYSKSLVEYVQIQQSLKSDEVRECYGCSKHLGVAAYCFKCNDFLCKDCHNFHITNKMMKDHQKHTLSLEDIEAKNITIEKLASMRGAPRCNTHPEKMSELYCETCKNLPVCMACTYGEHKGHNLHEVKALAKLKREKLAKQLKGLEGTEENKKPMRLEKAKEKLILNVSTQKEKVRTMHDEKDQKILTEIQNIEARREHVKQEKQNTQKKMYDYLRRQKETEIENVKKRYDKIFKVNKIKINYSFQVRESSLEMELANLREYRERFERDKKELLDSLEKQLNENMKIIETMSQDFDNIKKRFETLNVRASSILASDNDWSAAQCIPDMCTAATNLMKDLKEDFTELTTLTDVTVNYKQYSFGKPGVTKISENFDKKITINDRYHRVFGMTSSGDGNIVISGVTSDLKSFIAVIDMNGRILQEKTMNTIDTIHTYGYYLNRYCKFLSQYKVASVFHPSEIGLYDVRDGSYIMKNIPDVINSWPKDRWVTCVATDPVNNHILVVGKDDRDVSVFDDQLVVGEDIREVYVFDDQLNYLHILTLSEMIKGVHDITVSDGHLVVCDYIKKKCYVTTMDGLESQLVGEFMKPKIEGNWIDPISVCSDKNGFIYVLWKKFITVTEIFSQESYLVQYNHDGSQVLTMRELDGDANVVTVVEASQREKLVVATFERGALRKEVHLIQFHLSDMF